MPCKNPISLFQSGKGTIWNENLKSFGRNHSVPCEQCGYCRFVRTRQWALRCYLENEHLWMSQKRASAFISLTYSPEHLPENGTLVKKHLQDFMKRLRANLAYENPELTIRFYASGEYGENGTHRPHYHILIFGYDFPDKRFLRYSKRGYKLYRSAFLEKCWKLGHSHTADISLASAAYVAGYIRKKINGDQSAEHYAGRLPEFSLQSTSPGIGADWYEANKKHLWQNDKIQCEGRTYRPPRYFEKLFKKEDPEGYAAFQKRKALRTPLNHPGYPPIVELPDEDSDE